MFKHFCILSPMYKDKHIHADIDSAILKRGNTSSRHTAPQDRNRVQNLFNFQEPVAGKKILKDSKCTQDFCPIFSIKLLEW